MITPRPHNGQGCPTGEAVPCFVAAATPAFWGVEACAVGAVPCFVAAVIVGLVAGVSALAEEVLAVAPVLVDVLPLVVAAFPSLVAFVFFFTFPLAVVVSPSV